VFDTQIKAGLLPPTATFDMARFVADAYLAKARASVKFD
jgi:hypothetical protein